MAVPTTGVRARGVVTIPKSVREANNIRDGQQYSVHDLGDGKLLFSPRPSQMDALCDDLRDSLLARGATLEGMLEELRRMREPAGG
jgi:bifunctional DNA-binding transcriptional regulator/antitoxin component of YhaV-PrlF toxin-antitoxin module